MRRRIVLAASLCLLCGVLLSGCSDPSSPVAPDDFTIHLAAPGYDLEMMLAGTVELDAIELQGNPVITMDDVRWYHWGEHAILFSSRGSKRLAFLEAEQVFVVSVAGERIYQGAFWESYSSALIPGVMLPLNHVIGYEAPTWIQYVGLEDDADPRDDYRIRQIFEDAGKLLVGAIPLP